MTFAESGLTGQPAVYELLQMLDLEEIDDSLYRGRSPDIGPQRVYGGLVAGQALVAAGRSVDPERTVHSLHGYFVRPGARGTPIVYDVENIRDGRSFSVRRTVARQHGKPIFFMSASFHRPEEGLEHASEVPPGVPPPEQVPTMTDRLARYPERLGFWAEVPRPIDVRYVGEPGWVRSGDRPLLDAVLSVHGEVWGPGGFAGASLDHALWFHRPFRADEWFLYDCASPSASGGRGLAKGQMFDATGRHIASAVQEGLLRRVER